MRIKHQAQLILIGIAIGTTVVSALGAYSSSQSLIESAKLRDMQLTVTLIQNSLKDQAGKAAARASMVASLPSLQEAFRARNRELLLERVLPALKVQRDEYGVREGQFHLAPATSFLRVFAPTVGHGEDLSAFRDMVVATNREQKPQRGIEIGRRGLSVRGCYPVKDAQGPIGSFEIGMDFSPVLLGCKKARGYEAGVFVDDALFTKVANQLPRPDGERIVGGLQAVEATNWQALRPLVTPELLAKGKAISMSMQHIQGADYGTVLVPLLDFKDTHIGTIVAIRNFESFQTQSRWSLVGIASTALLQLVLLMGVLSLLVNALLLKPLDALKGAAKKLAAGEEASDLAWMAKADDEVGVMARHLEALGKDMASKKEPSDAL